MAYGRVNITGLSKTKEREYLREIANLSAVADIYDNRTVGATGVWYDLLDGTNDYSKGQLDTTITKANIVLNVGETILTDKVESTTGFKIGQEITIQDDVNKETVNITKANTTELEITALTKAYKKNASIFRSNVILDTTSKTMKIGNFIDKRVYDKTNPVSVVNSVCFTSANARPVLLENGWIVVFVRGATTPYGLFYVSKDSGDTWQNLCNTSYPDSTASIALASKGNYVFALYTNSGGYVQFNSFDATTQANVDITSNGTELDSPYNTSSQMDNVSIAVSQDGAKICATWSSKRENYPLSFNIRVCQGVINSNGSIAWGSIEQITTDNTDLRDIKRPCVTYMLESKPIMVYDEKLENGNYNIYCRYWNGAAWGGSYVIARGPYIQYSTQIITQRYGSYVGRVWCAWYGYDSTDPNRFNVGIKYSDDNGVTWTNGGVANEKLTSGNIYHKLLPSIAEDKYGNIYVGFRARDISDYDQIKMIKRTGDTWQAIEDITSYTSANSNYPSLCNNYYDFDKPLMVWADNENSRVAFYGVWTAEQNIPLLNSDVRYNITPESPSNEIVAWIDHEDDTGFSIDAELSVVTGSANEVYSPMTRTINDTGDVHEDEFVGVKSTKGDNVTVKFTLTRTDTGIDKSITKVLGAIGE